MDTTDEGHEWHGFGSELEIGGYAAKPKEKFHEIEESHDLVNDHKAAPEQYDYAEVIDITGEIATVKWMDGSGQEDVEMSSIKPAEQDIVSGRIDLGRCMFCGLCMEACPFESFFMTNEYDGMSGFTREELWMDADRTRVLPAVHQERVDMELAKRANKEKKKLARKAAKAEA